MKGKYKMSASKKEILKDLMFCKDLMDRLVEEEKERKEQEKPWYNDYHTVIQSDIIRLRRELNKVRQKLDWDYGRK